jgi:hypothetical protein
VEVPGGLVDPLRAGKVGEERDGAERKHGGHDQDEKRAPLEPDARPAKRP